MTAAQEELVGEFVAGREPEEILPAPDLRVERLNDRGAAAIVTDTASQWRRENVFAVRTSYGEILVLDGIDNGDNELRRVVCRYLNAAVTDQYELLTRDDVRTSVSKDLRAEHNQLKAEWVEADRRVRLRSGKLSLNPNVWGERLA